MSAKSIPVRVPDLARPLVIKADLDEGGQIRKLLVGLLREGEVNGPDGDEHLLPISANSSKQRGCTYMQPNPLLLRRGHRDSKHPDLQIINTRDM